MGRPLQRPGRARITAPTHPSAVPYGSARPHPRAQTPPPHSSASNESPSLHSRARRRSWIARMRGSSGYPLDPHTFDNGTLSRPQTSSGISPIAYRLQRRTTRRSLMSACAPRADRAGTPRPRHDSRRWCRSPARAASTPLAEPRVSELCEPRGSQTRDNRRPPCYPQLGVTMRAFRLLPDRRPQGAQINTNPQFGTRRQENARMKHGGNF